MTLEQIREKFPEIRERIPELRERIPEFKERIPEIKEKFGEAAERLPDPNVAAVGAGGALFAAGTVTATLNALSGKKHTTAWILPVTLLSSGLALALTGLLRRRSERIATAYETIGAELDSLDPLARAKILRELAEHEIKQYVPESE